MTPESPNETGLTRLVEYLDRPAFVASLSSGRVLASNSAALRKYDMAFAEGTDLELPDELGTPGQDLFLALGDPSFPSSLVVAPEANATFVLHRFEPSLAIVLEVSPAISSRKTLPSEAPPDTPSSEGLAGVFPLPHFHFGYVHDLVKARRAFADPALLLSHGIVETLTDTDAIDWRSLIVDEDISLYDSVLAAATDHGGSHKISYRIRGVGGRIVCVCDLCSVTQQPGKWPTLVGTVIAAEGSAARIKQLERQALAGRLIRGMIHDFKNLVAGVHNMIEWCIAQSTPQGKVHRALCKTIGYTDQANRLLTGVPRLFAGEEEDAIQQANLGDIVRGLEDLIRHLLPAHIALDVSIAPDIPHVYGRQGALQDMLLNLCVNARDAMVEKGSLLAIGVIPVTGEDGQDFVRLRVQDDGCGMPKSLRNSIFEAFYSTKEQGAGLGLWMVREAARAIDGHIELASEPGKGTTFDILLPAAEPAAPQENVLPAPACSDAPVLEPQGFEKDRTLLFVEDDPLVRSGVSIWLENLGFRLFAAADAHAALELFAEHGDDIDVIVQDFIIPGMRGDELLKRFLAVRPELPIIVVSALAGVPDEGEDVPSAVKGAFAFLRKPFRIEELVSLLRQALVGEPNPETAG